MNDQTTVLVTGSSGFLGRHLVPYLAGRGYKVIAASRRAPAFQCSNMVTVPLPDLSIPFDWQSLLQQSDAVVHLAGIAHTFADDDLYDRVNHRATEALARAASRSGAHLIFVSSIAAQSGSFSDCELTEEDRRENQLSLERGFRLLSSYRTDAGDTKLWVITEADRSATTILLPEEY